MKLAFTKETVCRWIFACENRVIACEQELLGAISLSSRCWERFLVLRKTGLQFAGADLSSVYA